MFFTEAHRIDASRGFSGGRVQVFPIRLPAGLEHKGVRTPVCSRRGGCGEDGRTGGVLYRKLIEWEQGKKMYVKGDTVLLNDSVITSYQFRKNYYFVAGDHSENSQDSRYWGLLPEEYIVGVASRVWKSVDSYTGDIAGTGMEED